MIGPNKSITIPKSKEAWNYLKNALPSSLFTSKKRKKRKRELPHSNLSMLSELYDTTTESIVAKSFDEINACREVLSCLFGVGVRKRFPNKSNVHNNQKNPIPLKSYDIINVVDLSPSADEELELDSDVDAGRFNPDKGNFLRWHWNPVTRLCTTTIRCVPLVVSCNSASVISFLTKFRIELMNDASIDGWHTGTRIFGDGRMFEIIYIDHEQEDVTIASVTRNKDVTKVISFEELNNNYSRI